MVAAPGRARVGASVDGGACEGLGGVCNWRQRRRSFVRAASGQQSFLIGVEEEMEVAVAGFGVVVELQIEPAEDAKFEAGLAIARLLAYGDEDVFSSSGAGTRRRVDLLLAARLGVLAVRCVWS